MGERFHKLLDRAIFKKHLDIVEGLVKGRSDLDIRLRFSLGGSVFDGLWESILNAEGEHLMLKAAITRRARDAVGNFAKPQATAVGPLNILVIGSTVDDNSVPAGPGDVLWKKKLGQVSARVTASRHRRNGCDQGP